MKIEVTKLNIANEMDVVLAHRRAMQIAKFAGISLPEQTRFATAVSEICRNCLEYAREGNIIFYADNDSEKAAIEAEIRDKGKGITGLDKILERDPLTYRGRGLGIIFARRLSDQFEIRSGTGGTVVRIRKTSFSKKTSLSKIIIDGWKKHIQDEPSLSAYEELKIRNAQLLEITDELRQQKDQIELLNQRLRQSNKNMQEFTFAISHDLKTPLTSLKLSLSLMQPGEKDARLTDVINRSVNRLDKTIHGLIDILHIQNPDKQVIRDVRFAQLMQEVEEDHRASIQSTKAKIHLNFKKAETLSYLEGYAKSILTNLISNSVKYRSALPLSITILTEPTKKGVRLTYTDNGIGIDLSQNSSDIFKPFRRLTTVGEGKGIGLYMIKTMVENNGGSVQVSSTPGTGTTFIFDLVKYE
ncbi:sensor histidine kinase [Terrimonas sp. NA20]|uniref:histidine kinase n=1 Tax=Terrimonas ginsenosidimutans TaxID=2908004 RepID=A0ABS9KPM0_9BACT|nr:sensor histidine kinase [Terrimonas ginsenosidimutans]MCG2614263.1 sensor histidine kinase [Terrimonas ginsenosidimutans]